jgi:hypothetical protein
MSQPTPQGKEGFNQRIIEDYQKQGYHYIVKEDDYECPEITEKSVMLRYVSIAYCESFCFGQGCQKKSTCPAYLNQKKTEENKYGKDTERPDDRMDIRDQE